MWESEQENAVEDDLLLSTPLANYPDIFHYFFIPVESYESSVSVDVTTFNHSQNSWSASSFECREVKSFLPDPPNITSYLSGDIDGEICNFPSFPVHESSDNEGAPIFNLETFGRGCCDLFIDSFDHDSDYYIVDISKPPTFDDKYFDELELPQSIEEL